MPWPEVDIRILPDGRAEGKYLSIVYTISAAGEDSQGRVRAWLGQVAREARRTLTVRIVDPMGAWPLLCAPDGRLSNDPTHANDAAPRLASFSAEQAGARTPADPSDEAPQTGETKPERKVPPATMPEWERPASQAPPAASATPETATSFLAAMPQRELARHGWRAGLNQIGFHLRPGPSEKRERERVKELTLATARGRTIAVVNGKGGAGKTPTTALLGQAFATYGAASVLTWDVNPTRGTLGWRTLQGPHEATVADLVASVDVLRDADTPASYIEAFVHRQSANLAVLRSQPDVLADKQVLGPESVRGIHHLLRRYFSTIIMDSGNDESSQLWRSMIALADHIVVPTTTREDTAESARLLLDNLARSEATRHLAARAVVVVSKAAPTDPNVEPVVERFRSLEVATTAIPYDPAIGNRYVSLDNLASKTRRAWLDATLMVGNALG